MVLFVEYDRLRHNNLGVDESSFCKSGLEFLKAGNTISISRFL